MIKLEPRAPRKTTETDLVYQFVVAIMRIPGVRASRNNVGTLRDKRGIPITYGLGDGSPDIVGVLTFGGVESSHVGLVRLAPIALAFGIEVKRPREDGGKAASRAQRGWHHVAIRRGMPVGVVRTEEEAVAFVLDLRTQLSARLRAIGGSLA